MRAGRKVMRFVLGLLPISDTMVAWLASKFCKPQKWSNKRAKCSSQSLTRLWFPITALNSRLASGRGEALRPEFLLPTFLFPSSSCRAVLLAMPSCHAGSLGEGGSPTKAGHACLLAKGFRSSLGGGCCFQLITDH